MVIAAVAVSRCRRPEVDVGRRHSSLVVSAIKTLPSSSRRRGRTTRTRGERHPPTIEHRPPPTTDHRPPSADGDVATHLPSTRHRRSLSLLCVRHSQQPPPPPHCRRRQRRRRRRRSRRRWKPHQYLPSGHNKQEAIACEVRSPTQVSTRRWRGAKPSQGARARYVASRVPAPPPRSTQSAFLGLSRKLEVSR